MEKVVGTLNDRTSIFFSSVGFSISVLVFMIILFIIFTRKRKEGANISMLFYILMTMAFLPLIFEIAANAIAAFVPISFGPKEIIYNVLIKLYIIVSMYWIVIYGYYVSLLVIDRIKNRQIDEKVASRKRMITYSIFSIICFAIGPFLPYSVQLTGPQGSLYLSGIAISVLNIEFFLVYSVMVLIIILNKSKFPDISFWPYILLYMLFLLLTFFGYSLGYFTNNLCSFFGFLSTVIFFTVESQDTTILENYKTSKLLEEENKRKIQDFLVNISYQVRTPMHNIIGYGELVDEKYDLSFDETKVIGNDIKTSVLSLRNMLSAIIDVSSIQRNQVTVNQENYDSRSLIGDINNYVISNKLKEQLNFSISSDSNLPINLYGDVKKIYYVLTKIIDNAIANTNYGEVKLEILNKVLDSQFTEIIFTISNSGHVMTEEMYNMKFEDYVSSNESLDSNKLCLTVAKTYIDLLGGNIEFINKEGQGTKYIIKLRQKIVNNIDVSN